MHSRESTRSETESFLNVSTRKTTHSWPIICRQSNHYASEDDDDDDDDDGYDDDNACDDGYIDGNATDDDSDNDIDTIFPTKNRSLTPIPSAAATFIDNLSCRKYLVADYNPKQSTDYYTTSTITSVVNAQSDFPISLKLNSGSVGRLTRNSIVPLMSPQLQTPTRARTSLHEANVSSAVMNAAVSIDQTTCIAPPPILFLLLTLLTTVSATGLLCLAVMTDHWEIIRWDRNLLDHLTSNTSNELNWLLDEKVARLSFARNYSKGKTLCHFVVEFRIKLNLSSFSVRVCVFVCLGHGRTDNIFLVPMHGGIWTLCIDLNENEMRQLGPYGFPNAVKCISYLAESTDINASEEYSQHGSYQATRRPSMSKLY